MVPDIARMAADQAASAVRSVDFSRAGFLPSGFLGEWSRLDSASRISPMETVRFAPGMARKDGHEVKAAAPGRRRMVAMHVAPLMPAGNPCL